MIIWDSSPLLPVRRKDKVCAHVTPPKTAGYKRKT
jgi:hypothetical protein